MLWKNAAQIRTALPDDTRQRIDMLARQTPEWRSWLTILEEVLHAAQDPAWHVAVPQLRSVYSASTVLLDGVTLTVEPQLVHIWVCRLLRVAAVYGSRDAGVLAEAIHAKRLDASRLLEAVICQDLPLLTELFTAAGTDPQALASVVDLIALPLLQACGRRLSSHVSPAWPHGYCPICGAWPVLTELRGLERARRLRCARCGGDWGMPWLHCLYCHTTDHEQLGSLLPATKRATHKVDTCTACKSYSKAVNTLRAWPVSMVLLEDLATLELDIAALEHGYTRPQRPGIALTVHIAAPSWYKRRLRGWRLERA